MLIIIWASASHNLFAGGVCDILQELLKYDTETQNEQMFNAGCHKPSICKKKHNICKAQ